MPSGWFWQMCQTSSLASPPAKIATVRRKRSWNEKCLRLSQDLWNNLWASFRPCLYGWSWLFRGFLSLTDSGFLTKTLVRPSWYWSASMFTQRKRCKTPCCSAPRQCGHVSAVRMAYLAKHKCDSVTWDTSPEINTPGNSTLKLALLKCLPYD